VSKFAFRALTFVSAVVIGLAPQKRSRAS